MAIYVPPSTRRRRLVLLVVVGLVVGLVAGFGLGRATSTSVDDAIALARDQASDAAIALQRIPIEYEQAVKGSGGESTRTITEAIANARSELSAAWADAPWFGTATRKPVDARLATLDRAVEERATATEFKADVDAAVAAIASAFGLTLGDAG